MAIDQNLADTLLEEAMVEMADNFFGARRRLEDEIGVFKEYVEALGKKAREVEKAAGVLNHLLLNRRTAETFHAAIHRDAAQAFGPCTFPGGRVPIPFAFTTRGIYTKLVADAYAGLRNACDIYLNGDTRTFYDETGPQGEEVYYKLVESMCGVINENTEKINNERSPSATLHYARRFNPEAVDKQRIIGGTIFGGNGRGLDGSLRFEPICLDALGLKRFPELPAGNTVSSTITSFCGRVYARDKHGVKALLAGLENWDV